MFDTLLSINQHQHLSIVGGGSRSLYLDSSTRCEFSRFELPPIESKFQKEVTNATEHTIPSCSSHRLSHSYSSPGVLEGVARKAHLTTGTLSSRGTASNSELPNTFSSTSYDSSFHPSTISREPSYLVDRDPRGHLLKESYSASDANEREDVGNIMAATTGISLRSDGLHASFEGGSGPEETTQQPRRYPCPSCGMVSKFFLSSMG